MTEEQVRDVLARVVPEAPDSVSDAAPVVRAARRRRRVRTTVAGAAAVLVVAGSALGVQVLRHDDRTVPVADDPAPEIADPYATAPCPALGDRWISVPVEDLDQVVAVRYCARGVDTGFPVAGGPGDALVDDVSVFSAAVRGLAPADPMRCAAVDPVPTDSRLLLQLASGSYVGIPAGLCQDAEVEGRTLDAAAVASAFLDALRGQRDEHDYVTPGLATGVDCASLGDVTPALPGHESLKAAVVCDADGSQTAVEGPGLERLNEAWARPGPVNVDPCPNSGEALPWVFAYTDRGDLVRLDPAGCGYLSFQGSEPDSSFGFDLKVGELTGG